MRIGRSKARYISEISIDTDIAMAAHKLTGLAAGIAAGESVRYEQLTPFYMLQSSYTGNDANDRQITTGFQCKLVIIQEPTIPGLWLCFSDSFNFSVLVAVIHHDKVDLLLHATDGFVVDQISANYNAKTYNYLAIGI